jgi:hypothetical protein
MPDGETADGPVELGDLLIDNSNPTATARRLAAHIAQRYDFLFNGNAPVRIAVEACNLPRAIEVTNEAVRVLAHQISNPKRLSKHEWIPAALPKDIASLYLNGLEGNWGLRPFRGITTAPILSANGNIRIADGYDEATGLWCHSIPDLELLEQPTKTEAHVALYRLRGFSRTFPFADGAQIQDPELGGSCDRREEAARP